VRGTTEWTPYSVVLDASENAHGIFFGTLMNGKGQLWISNVRFEVVGAEVPVTNGARLSRQEPGNLELAR